MKKVLQTTILCCVLISPPITVASSIEQKKYSPTAIIEIQKGKTEGEAPLSINLDGSKSTDPQNLNLEYLWEYPDKIIQSKNPRSYKFKKPGKYTIKLTVKNSLGAKDTSILEINILKKKEKQGDLSDKIIINEILPNPKGKDLGHEWIELYNNSNKNINLHNWKISNSKSSQKIENLTIKAKDHLILENLKFNIKNKNEKITLYDFNEKLISQLEYSRAKEGLSYSNKKTWNTPSKNNYNNKTEVLVGKIYKTNKTFKINNKNILMNKKTNKKLLNLIIEDEKEVKIKAELINETYQLLEIEFKNLKTKKKTKNNWTYKIIILCELLLTPLIFFYNKSLRSIAV